MHLAAIKLIDVLKHRLVGELVNTHVIEYVREPTLFTQIKVLDMPKKIVAYACEYNCGWNVLTNLKRMIIHESRCNWNASNRACITCKNLSPRGELGPAECDAGADISEKLRNNCSMWSAARGT